MIRISGKGAIVSLWALLFMAFLPFFLISEAAFAQDPAATAPSSPVNTPPVPPAADPDSAQPSKGAGNNINPDTSTNDQALDLVDRRFHASLLAEEAYTNNFFYEPDNQNTVYGTLLGPRLDYAFDAGDFALGSSAFAEYGKFNTVGSHDDYLDRAAELHLGLAESMRAQFRIDGKYQHGHDPFGTDRTESVNIAFHDTNLDQWDRTEGGLHLHYGSPGSTASVDVGGSAQQNRYANNRSATRFLDYNSIIFDYALFYNYSAKTSALVDFSRTHIHFDSPFAPGTASSGNGNEYRMHAGVRWLATAKTSGDVRFGILRRTFETGSPDLGEFDWQAHISWSPITLSLIELNSGRSIQQTYTASARAIDTRNVTLTYTQTWTARYKTRLELSATEANFVGDNRKDKTYSPGLSNEYLLWHSVVAYLNGNWVDRQSATDPSVDFSYRRLNVLLGFRITY